MDKAKEVEDMDSYERDASPGKVEVITLAEMEKMLEEKQSFAVAFMKTDCSYCHDFSSMLQEYQKNHNMTMYEVILDQEPLTPEENREIIQKYFPVFDKTPGLFYAQNGEMASFIPTTKEDMTPENFDAWVLKFQMDKMK